MKGISEKTLIKIKDLKASVKLNNGDMLTTVTNANMELQRGRSYAIVGKSGSGKTSLISIIGLLNREYEGEYLYDGISISALKDRDLSEVLGKETIDTYNTSDTRGTSQSYGLNYQKLGRDMPYLFVKSSVALNFT